MKNIINSLALSFLGIVFLLGCSSDTSSPIEIGDNERQLGAMRDIQLSQSQFDVAKMQLGQIKEYDFPIRVQATGIVDVPTKSQATISAYAGGYVKNINLIPGEKVKKGQVLFTLENPEFVAMQQTYLEAKEQLTFLQSDYERQKTLEKENIASGKNYLKAESDYKVTLARIEGLKKRMALLNIQADKVSAQNLVSSVSIFSPISGYVMEVNAMKGMFLNPTDAAVKIANTDNLHLELNVFEKDILSIKEGQSIQFRIPDANQAVYEADVHLIGRVVEAESRVVHVHGHIKKGKETEILVPGMYVDAQIIIDANKSYGLPESAVVIEDGENFVLVYKTKKGDILSFEKVAVVLGERKEGLVEITNMDRFSGDEKILIEGGFNLIGIE